MNTVKAFPSSINNGMGYVDQQQGMDLRDYFAAKAMVAIILHPQGHAGNWNMAAKDAYEMSDAMMDARQK